MDKYTGDPDDDFSSDDDERERERERERAAVEELSPWAKGA